MSGLDGRLDLAVQWLGRNQVVDGQGGAGWGWVSDVPPNPQNTAEVVCALARAGREIPRSAEVLTLVRRGTVTSQHRGEWTFQSPVDVAWRLRALQCLGIAPTDSDVVDSIEALVAEQDSDTGGWRLSGRAGPVSVTATAHAIRALTGPATAHEGAARALLRATTFLISLMLDGDPRTEPLYACAYVASIVSQPEVAAVGGKRVERARGRVLERLLAGLRQGHAPVEEEAFRRGEVADTWRHLSLHLAVGAAVAADPHTIFEPPVRQALTGLLDLQETGELHTNCGGFRTSAEGFVTSYATTQALEAMVAVRTAVNSGVSPARVFDLICGTDGVHHTDAQNLVSVRGRSVVMNSHAGALLFAVGGSAGLTIAILAVIFADDLKEIGSRALVVWGTLFVAVGTFSLVSTRFPATPNGRIAAAVFAAFTAVVLPVVTFLLS